MIRSHRRTVIPRPGRRRPVPLYRCNWCRSYTVDLLGHWCYPGRGDHDSVGTQRGEGET